MRRHIAAHAIEKLDGSCAVQSQANIFDQLAIAHLDYDKRMGTGGEALKIAGGEGIQGDRPQQANFDSHRRELPPSRL